MSRVFPKPIPELIVRDVEDFLEGASEETLIWEAKADGDKPLRPEHVQKSVCAFANQIGGILIVGARKGDACWDFSGVQTPVNGEPGTWLNQVLRGLQPEPACTIQTFDLGDGRWGAVVEVEPQQASPCMTKDGALWERVMGETVKVTDPARVRELFRRGEDSRSRSQDVARRAVESARVGHDTDIGVEAAVSIAAAQYEDNVPGRLFTNTFREDLWRWAIEHLLVDLGVPRPAEDFYSAAIGQDNMSVVLNGPEQQWRARATWDGAVTVSMKVPSQRKLNWAVMTNGLIPAWILAARLVRRLGGYGAGAAEFRLARSRMGGYAGETLASLPIDLKMSRVIPLETPSEGAVGSIQRELNRASHLWSLEDDH